MAIGSNSFADSHIDFSLSDFCYLQPNVQDRNGVYYFPNQTKGITAKAINNKKSNKIITMLNWQNQELNFANTTMQTYS